MREGPGLPPRVLGADSLTALGEIAVPDHNHALECPACEESLARERSACAAAEEATRARDDFFLTLSHELRGPLNAIMSWVYLLQSGKLDAPAVVKALETVARNASTEARLITDMLDVSRIIAGQLRIAREPVDLATIIGESTDTVRPTADRRGVHLETEYNRTDGVITADPQRLRQVVENLLLNAIKFTPIGGRIAVRLGYDANAATIAVRDNGQGISSALLPHVFERFTQGTLNAPGGGLGLGLAIVRHIVALHGGNVVAHSDGVGLGATFTVTLPMDEARPGVVARMT